MSVRRRYLITSLVLLAVAFGYALTQSRVERPALPRPAGVAASPRVPPPRPLPSAREVLNRGAALSLTADQKRRLEGLEREWSGESARLESELRTVTDEFSRFMGEAQSNRGTSLEEIRRRSADVGELSAGLRERRRLHGEAAAGLLTDRQRMTLAQGTPAVPTGGDR